MNWEWIDVTAGFIYASVIWYFLWAYTHRKHRTEVRILHQEILRLLDGVFDLEQKAYPQYVVRNDGVIPVAERNPPQDPELVVFDVEDWGPGGGETTKIGEQDRWDPLKGKYR